MKIHTFCTGPVVEGQVGLVLSWWDLRTVVDQHVASCNVPGTERTDVVAVATVGFEIFHTSGEGLPKLARLISVFGFLEQDGLGLCRSHCRIAHYSDVTMRAMTSQISGVSIVCLTVCSGADQRKHQSSASLAFVRGIRRWPVDSPDKGQ